MVFQWFWQRWTITIECFWGGPTIETNGFSMVFKILRAMVNNGLFYPLWSIFSPLWSIFNLIWTLFEKNTISSPCEWLLFGSKWLTLRFEETIANFQWFLRRPSPLNVFWAVWPLPSMVLRWFFDVATIAFDGFWWFRTIGQTMRWFRWIVVVYWGPIIDNLVQLEENLNSWKTSSENSQKTVGKHRETAENIGTGWHKVREPGNRVPR